MIVSSPAFTPTASPFINGAASNLKPQSEAGKTLIPGVDQADGAEAPSDKPQSNTATTASESNTGKQNGDDPKKPIEGSPEATREALKDPNSPEYKLVQELKQRDREVRAHEQAHLVAAGPHARGGPFYDYQKGPDGRNYAVGGHVNIDTAAVPGDPEATLRKAETIRRAALAPAEPSSQDRQVAAQATSMAAEARQEILQMRLEESGTKRESGDEVSAEQERSNKQQKADLQQRLIDSGAMPEPAITIDIAA
ncbi:MAG: putative metalloprotease CJM1_0395 family protein [Pseudomonadota bacterium]